MIQSAADILGKVHKWGWGGGCILYIIFDLVLEAKIAVPAVSPHLTLYRLGWNSYFGLQYEVKIDICIDSAPLPPQRKEGPVYLPTHGVCLCLRPNLIHGFSGVDWGWGGVVYHF